MKREDARKLAEEHWEWLEPILRWLDRPLTVEEVEYLFRTAMEHGVKHGQEFPKS